MSALIVYATTIIICFVCLIFGIVGLIAFWRTQNGGRNLLGYYSKEVISFALPLLSLWLLR